MGAAQAQCSCCSSKASGSSNDEEMSAVANSKVGPYAEDCVDVPNMGKVASSSNRPALNTHGTRAISEPVAAQVERKAFPTRPRTSQISEELWAKAQALFEKMDADGSNCVTRQEAMFFFKGAFAKMSVDAMFNEVDNDHSGFISAEEFMNFWKQVRAAGYPDKDIQEEMDELLDGNTWVDWNDGRNVNTKHAAFPKRPWLCRLSKKGWLKCEELFKKMDSDGNMTVTRQEADKLFSKGFSKISVNAMFNEIDVDKNGDISANEFMKFWVNVKSHGYKESLIIEEVDNILSGGAWVDWKDGRKT